MHKYLLLVIIISHSFCLFGQKSKCISDLEKARSMLAKGHLYEIPNVLEQCLRSGFTKEQKLEAYLILTKTYFLLDENLKSEQSYLEILKIEPEYVVNNQTDDMELVFMSKNYTARPIFEISIKLGANFTQPKTILNDGVDNTNDTKENYSMNLGMNVGAGLILNLTNYFSVIGEVSYSRKSYYYKNILFDNDVQTFSENIDMIETPFYLRFRTSYRKIYPFFFTGYSLQYLINSSANVKLVDNTTIPNQETFSVEVTGPLEQITNQRNTINHSLVFGTGLSFRARNNYFFLDFRFSYGLSNIVNQDTQYSNNNLVYQYGIVEDLKRIQTYTINFGFIKPLYKPRKINKKIAVR